MFKLNITQSFTAYFAGWGVRFMLFLLAFFGILKAPAQKTTMLDMKYPYETQFVDLDDNIRIAYIDQGTGKYTLIFIHGLGSYLPAWKKNIDDLKLRYRCIALDLPGYGKSSKGEHDYNMSFFASVLRQFVEKLQLRNVVLVGHSMGGQIALTAALQNTEHIEKLVLLAPAGFETFSAQEKQVLRNLYTPAILKGLPTEQIRKNFEVNFVKFPEDAEFMYQDRLFMRETEEYDRYCAMIPQCVAGMLDEPVFDQLPQIKIPTLVLYGADDALIPNKFLHPTLTTEMVAKAGATCIPGSKLQMIPKAGHFVQWEGAKEVNKVIKKFLGK